MLAEYELPLLKGHHTKTIDFGDDGIAVSLSTHARILSLAAFHPVEGQVVAEAEPQFDKTKHLDQPFVRHYRMRSMRAHNDENGGFGLSLSAKTGDGDFKRLEPKSWKYVNGSFPRVSSEAEDCKATITSFVEDGKVIQQVDLENNSDDPKTVNVDFAGNIAVNRAAYSQLTAAGDFSIPDPRNVVSVNEQGDLVIRNPNLGRQDSEPERSDSNLGSALTVQLSADDQWTGEWPDGADSPQPLAIARKTSIDLAPGAKRSFAINLALDDGSKHKAFRAPGDQLPRDEVQSFIVQRNLDYLMSCCRAPVTSVDGRPMGTCIFTDHMCLPLGWTRDNFFQLQNLTAVLNKAESFVHPEHLDEFKSRLVETQASHLDWVFNTAERPDGHWSRSYFATGKPKDGIYQLDQQCFPLLELAEFARDHPDRQDLVTSAAKKVDTILENIHSHRWPDDGTGTQPMLFTTDETPADDEVAQPFHFSSHVLLWHTLKELETLQKTLPDGSDIIQTPVGEWADRIKSDTETLFKRTHAKHGEIYAYTIAMDSSDYDLYHDSNDLPFALAPQWGFCEASDPTWQGTVRFAHSTDNKKGFYPGGRFGGLGSRHTEAPWTLGYAQDLIISGYGVKGLVKPSDEILDLIKASTQWDGMSSEAVDNHDGKVVSKNWFGWPGSSIGKTLLDRASTTSVAESA